MYRVAICDDNTAEGQHVLELTRRVLCERNIDVAFSLFADPGKLLTDIQEEHHRYDLLLLDMLFDKTNGIHIAKTLRDVGEQVPIIYTTISQDYAIDGYKVQASDYLVKPIELTPLAEAIDRILGRRDTLWVKSDGVPKQISVSDIQYVEAVGNYVVLRTSRQEELRLRATLSEALQKLGHSRFARCHKGYLVNLGQVREIRTNAILLHNGDIVPLGRQYRVELQKKILDFVEKAIPH